MGLVPKGVLVEAGRYFLRKQQRSLGIPESEVIKIAVKSLGLDDLKPFDPKEKVIEYLLGDEDCKGLVDLTVKGFAIETAGESPAPGGGSVAACMGAFGAALGTMVANLSSHKAGWDDKWEYYSQFAERGNKIMNELIHLVDEDTAAFNRIMVAFGMPKTSDEDKRLRSQAIQEATLYATEIPLKTMEVAYSAFDIIEVMVKEGLPSSVSDAGVGAIALRGAIYGAYLNVMINAAGLKNIESARELTTRAAAILAKAQEREREALNNVLATINK